MLCETEAHCVFATNLYDTAHCARIVRRAKSVDEWDLAGVRVESDGNSCDAVLPETRAALIVDRDRAPDLYEGYEDRVRFAIRPLVRKLWGIDLPRCEGTQLIRYKTGGHYVPHKDSDEMEFANRYFTVLCYLNDDFQGGGTRFPSLKHTVRSVPGKTLIFPSHYLHAAEPVMEGEKFILLTWMCGPAPVRWI